MKQVVYVLVLLCAAVFMTAAGAAAVSTEIVSVSSSGGQGSGYSQDPKIDSSGNVVTFWSYANDLAPDTNSSMDCFVHDRTTGQTEIVSVDSSENQGTQYCGWPKISGNGQFVVYETDNVFALNDTNATTDVYIRDRSAGITELVSIGLTGYSGNSSSMYPSTNENGRYVAYTSYADNLVPNDLNGNFDVFVYDRNTGTTEMASVSTAGVQGNGSSREPMIRGNDNAFVIFHSSSSNLVANDTNGLSDVFVRDLAAGTTELVSKDSSGVPGNNDAYGYGFDISLDGRYVTFASEATNLVASDTNGTADVFVHDRSTHTTTLVSVSSDGIQGNGKSTGGEISRDGRFVVFSSDADNLVANDLNNRTDVFVRDLVAGKTWLVSRDSSGVQGDRNSFYPSIGYSASAIAFYSDADNLIALDINNRGDSFVHDRNSIVVTKADYKTNKSLLTVWAQSDYADVADLEVVIGTQSYPMAYSAGKWTVDITVSPKPSTITVSGPEGSTDVAVQ